MGNSRYEYILLYVVYSLVELFISFSSPKPEVPEDSSRKRKLEDDDESENGDSNKR